MASDLPTNYRPLPQQAPKLKDAPRNPVNPSIPSKWETRPLPRNHSADGFGSRNDRFHDNPVSILCHFLVSFFPFSPPPPPLYLSLSLADFLTCFFFL
jgi:hypothetical protein